MKKILVISIILCIHVYSQESYPDGLDFGEIEINNVATNQINIFSESLIIIDSVNIINQYFPEDNNSFQAASVNIIGQTKADIEIHFEPKDNINYSGMLAVYYRSLKSIITNDTISKIAAIELSGNGVLPEPIKDYYNGSQNTFGPKFRTVLNSSISNHIEFSYRDARIFMWETADNQSGEVECLYTGRILEHSDGIPDVQSTRFNTEHVWPRSFGADDEPEKSDLHHIFPTYEIANSRRANYKFGFIDDVIWSEGGSSLGTNSSGETLFQVREEKRGDVARAIMYFATKYSNVDGYIDSQLGLLKKWSKNDPPDEYEINRNDAAFSFQENRNPYIDNPLFINRFADFRDFEDPRDSIQIYIPEDTLYVYDLSFDLPIFYYGKENITWEVKSDLCELSPMFINNFNGELKANGDVNYIKIEIPIISASKSSSADDFDSESCFEIVFSNGEVRNIVFHFNAPTSVNIDNDYLPYPNPVFDFLSINPNAVEIQILDIQGNHQKIIRTSNKIDVSNLSTGLYLLKYKVESEQFYTKFIKD